MKRFRRNLLKDSISDIHSSTKFDWQEKKVQLKIFSCYELRSDAEIPRLDFDPKRPRTFSWIWSDCSLARLCNGIKLYRLVTFTDLTVFNFWFSFVNISPVYKIEFLFLLLSRLVLYLPLFLHFCFRFFLQTVAPCSGSFRRQKRLARSTLTVDYAVFTRTFSGLASPYHHSLWIVVTLLTLCTGLLRSRKPLQLKFVRFEAKLCFEALWCYICFCTWCCCKHCFLWLWRTTELPRHSDCVGFQLLLRYSPACWRYVAKPFLEIKLFITFPQRLSLHLLVVLFASEK